MSPNICDDHDEEMPCPYCKAAPAAAPLGAGEALRGMVAAFWGDMDEEHKTSFRKEFPGHVVIRAEAALSSVPVDPAPQGPVAEESEHLARIIAPWFGFDPDKEWKRCIGNAAEIKAATLAKTKGLKNPGRDLLFEAAMMLGFWPDGAMEPYDKSDADDLRRKVHEYLRVTNPLAAQGPSPQVEETYYLRTLETGKPNPCLYCGQDREKHVANLRCPVSAPAAEGAGKECWVMFRPDGSLGQYPPCPFDPDLKMPDGFAWVRMVAAPIPGGSDIREALIRALDQIDRLADRLEDYGYKESEARGFLYKEHRALETAQPNKDRDGSAKRSAEASPQIREKEDADAGLFIFHPFGSRAICLDKANPNYGWWFRRGSEKGQWVTNGKATDAQLKATIALRESLTRSVPEPKARPGEQREPEQENP